MKYKKEKINNKIEIIERNLKFLERYNGLSFEDFQSDYMKIQAAKFSLLEIIESCIDISNHIIVYNSFRKVEHYSDMFKVLAENNILTKSLSEDLINMARFRNILVYRYGEIDDKRVLEIIQNNLTDIRNFEKEILERI